MEHKEKARQTLESFLKAWQNKDHALMGQFLQLTWKAENGGKWPLFASSWFLVNNMKKWRISEPKRIGQANYEFPLIISFSRGGRPQKRRISARIICENGPYEPGLDGSWGINPVSMLRGLS